ncbi:hypothetical protein LCGC14_0228830 [marine sediment metagenome]|jgi:hypothetical protein|uniref:3'-5' exoribonuclease Rv2179c-like domain-containing protein n=1 Tax=marine sediment metagenome TaxID=412755 RepID=A0A0F9UFS7_9ZZZZ
MDRTIEGTMIDSETLALGPRALIWEIAAVPFRISITGDGATWETTAQPYHTIIDYADMSTRGFDVDMQTIAWTGGKRRGDVSWDIWREKHFNPGADLAALPGAGVKLHVPDIALFNLWRIAEDKPVWFRNAAFDVPAIENLAIACKKDMPWHRRQQSDLYTQINMIKQFMDYDDKLPAAVEHSARADAIAQIGQLTDICGQLYSGRQPAPDQCPHVADVNEL